MLLGKKTGNLENDMSLRDYLKSEETLERDMLGME